MGAIKSLFVLMRAFLASRLSLAAEILALRQQVAVYKHTVNRPKLRKRDRIFCVRLSRLWSNWRSGLVIVQPETVIRLLGPIGVVFGPQGNARSSRRGD